MEDIEFLTRASDEFACERIRRAGEMASYLRLVEHYEEYKRKCEEERKNAKQVNKDEQLEHTKTLKKS